jgi:hypothetical protein
MPAISIDTFFACTLMITVVIGATVLSSGILDAHVSRYKDLNEDNYLRAASDYMLLNSGVPADWGSNGSTVPSAFGLAKRGSQDPFELDIDKVCRLNSQNVFALTYAQMLTAAELKNVALGVSVSQLLNVSATLYSNSTLRNATAYAFKVSVSQDGAPRAASLNCYVVAENFLYRVSGNASDSGVGYVDVEIPNVSNGTALFIVFARALHDARITAYGVYPFEHLFTELGPRNSFLNVSPLNHRLWLNLNYSGIVLWNAYAFSYVYQSNLTVASDTSYTIPRILDKSPIVLVVTGSNGSTFFLQWTSYPQIPLKAGADFSNAECHSFSYVVTVEGVFYELKFCLGGLSQ